MFVRPDVEAQYSTDYGESRTLRRTRHGWQIKRQSSTAPLALNRAVAPMVGERIRNARQAAGLTLEELCKRAGLVSATPKQRMWEIEMGRRTEGLRFGTLYAIAAALGIQATDLMPPVEDVVRESGVTFQKDEALTA